MMNDLEFKVVTKFSWVEAYLDRVAWCKKTIKHGEWAYNANSDDVIHGNSPRPGKRATECWSFKHSEHALLFTLKWC